MEISRYLRQHARTIAGKSQLFINSYAKALEVGGVWLLLSMNLIFLANVRNWPLFLGYKIIWGDELISLRSFLLGALGLRHPCPSVKHVYHVQHCCNQFCYLVLSISPQFDTFGGSQGFSPLSTVFVFFSLLE